MVTQRLGVKIGFAIGLIWLALMLASAATFGRALAAESPEDAAYVAQRLQEVLEFEKTGVDIPWKNPTTGSYGMIRIERTYYQNPKLPCRVYRRTQIMDDELTMSVEGTGCRVGDARWYLDEKPPSVEGGKSETTAAPAEKKPAAPAAETPSSPEPATTPGAEAKAPEAPEAPEVEAPKVEEKAEVPKPRKKAESKPAKPSAPKRPTFTFQLPTRTTLPDGGSS